MIGSVAKNTLVVYTDEEGTNHLGHLRSLCNCGKDWLGEIWLIGVDVFERVRSHVSFSSDNITNSWHWATGKE